MRQEIFNCHYMQRTQFANNCFYDQHAAIFFIMVDYDTDFDVSKMTFALKGVLKWTNFIGVLYLVT